MSLLSDSVLAGGSTRLHGGGRGLESAHKALRKSKSHGGFLNPLVQLVRDPVGSLSSAVGSYSYGDSNPESDAAAADASRRQVLYLRIKDAESYDEWKAAAAELDALEGNDAWKAEDDSPDYDATLVATRLKELDDARLSCDVRRMLFLIRTTLTRGLGDMGHLRLYQHSHIGTKKLIERYIESAQQTMAALLHVSAKQGDGCPVEARRLVEQLLQTRQSFGRSALLLSGGGTFGMNHIGVVRSLWDARLLPRIISGASAGSIVSAVLCTKTDEEIPDVLGQFCDGDLNVFAEPGESDNVVHKAVRLLKTGALFDISHLSRVMRGLLGDLTFQEAYNRTRRILNIPVSTSSLYELPRLLNYITAPNVMIWSAVCTSCSVPLVYKKASLRAKDPKTGKEVPWDPNPDATWIDGSVDNDLPMTRLAEMFNVNHFIVSQVNPHVVPFLAKEEEVIAAEAQNTVLPSGPGWISIAASLARGEVLHRLQELADIGFFPNLVTKARSILSQRYSGDINIFPKISYADFPRVLSNPTPEYMKGCMLAGQRATWPKLSRIQNHVAIELALDETIHKLRTRVVFAPSQINLRLNNLGRPISQGDELSQKHRNKSVHKNTRFELRIEPSSPVLRKSAPVSPWLVRTPLKTPPQLFATPKQQHKANASKPRTPGSQSADLAAALEPISSSNDTSDQDYFADPDSDTTDMLSSPSPPTSPTFQVPTLWPSVRQAPFISVSQPPTPLPAADTEWRSPTMFNLMMTSATPSEPERRYKRLFHPQEEAVQVDGSSITPAFGETTLSNRPGSRRGSIDHSGTRGMLLRKKSFRRVEPDGVLE